MAHVFNELKANIILLGQRRWHSNIANLKKNQLVDRKDSVINQA
jgi:hypothetical protein